MIPIPVGWPCLVLVAPNYYGSRPALDVALVEAAPKKASGLYTLVSRLTGHRFQAPREILDPYPADLVGESA